MLRHVSGPLLVREILTYAYKMYKIYSWRNNDENIILD